MQKLDPEAPIRGVRGLTVADFWAWAYSDLLTPESRNAFAQFVVAAELDVANTARVTWTGEGLSYRGALLRVRYAGHVAAWDVDVPAREGPRSTSDGKRAKWTREPELVDLGAEGNANAYVICHAPERDGAALDPLDVSHWEYYVLPHHIVQREAGEQRTLELRRLRFLADAAPLEELGTRLQRLLGLPD